MQAHKIETVMSENGTLILKELPFQAGEAVEVIILERPKQQHTPSHSSESPLEGTVSFYHDPFEPAVASGEWDVLQ